MNYSNQPPIMHTYLPDREARSDVIHIVTTAKIKNPIETLQLIVAERNEGDNELQTLNKTNSNRFRKRLEKKLKMPSSSRKKSSGRNWWKANEHTRRQEQTGMKKYHPV